MEYIKLNKRWSYEDVKFLLLNIHEGTRYVANHLNKDIRVVQQKCQKLGISNRKKSSHPFVFYDKINNKWRVYAILDYHILYKGSFISEQKAISQAYNIECDIKEVSISDEDDYWC